MLRETQQEHVPLQDGETVPKKRTKAKLLALAIAVIVVAIIIVVIVVIRSKDSSTNAGPIVILLIGDGFGPTSETLARGFATWRDPAVEMLALDGYQVGSQRTRSTDSLVTDSAAGATAFSCGLKTINGYIGMDSAGHDCVTLLELAKDKGQPTGMVATSRLTHATPASFASHVISRAMETEIASQEIVRRGGQPLVDVMLGGGRCYFLPTSSQGSCRTSGDLDDPLSRAQEMGYHVGLDRDAFDNGLTALPVLGLFADSHMAYDIDRVPTEEPSLAEMTNRALTLLSAEADRRESGFFLMVEGSRIDHAGHANDPAAQVRDTIAYHDAVEVIMEFAARREDVIVVATADHETGGVALGIDGIYEWRPEVLGAATHSTYFAAEQATTFAAGTPTPTDEELQNYVRETVLLQSLGLTVAEPIVVAIAAESRTGSPQNTLSAVISEAAGVGWSTGGHTGTDVNVYQYPWDVHAPYEPAHRPSHTADADKYASSLLGNHENTDIAHFLAAVMGVTLPIPPGLR